MYCFDVSHHQIIILSLMTLLENNKLFTIWEPKQEVLIGFIQNSQHVPQDARGL